MTYIPKVYELGITGWSATEPYLGIIDELEGNVAIIPDYIYDTDGHDVYDLYTFQGSDGGLWLDGGIKLKLPLGIVPSDIWDEGDEIKFYYSEISEIVVGTTYYVTYDGCTGVYIRLEESLGGGYMAIDHGYPNKKVMVSILNPVPFPGTIIKNKIGVAAVGVINYYGILSAGAINAYYPTLLRAFPLVGATPTGIVIVQNGWGIDFAQDLSQPSPVATYGINKEVFNFNDNDDKRKVGSRVVVRGKDLQGVSISVSLAGIRAYDTTRQFYNGCTYISRKSDGYIYKNNFAGETKAVTVSKTGSVDHCVSNYAVYPTKIDPDTHAASYTVDSLLVFSGSVPDGIKASTDDVGYPYYVVSNDGNKFEVSETKGGTPVTITSDPAFGFYATIFGKIQFDNSDSYFTDAAQKFFLSASSYPTGTSQRVYYIRDAPGTSATETAYIMKEGFIYPMELSSAGSDVVINKLPASGESDLGTTPIIYLYGWGYAIPSGSNMLASVPNGTTTAVVTTGEPVELTDSNGVMYTKLALTTWLLTDFSGRGYLLNKILYVDNYPILDVGGNPYILFGEERVRIDSTGFGNDIEWGNYVTILTLSDRITTSSGKHYPHGVGCMVANDYTGSGSTYYTVSNPEALSPIAQYGERVVDVTVDSNTTYGYLDAYATALLLGGGILFKKATCKGPITKILVKRTGDIYHNGAEVAQEYSRSTIPRVGDKIEVTDHVGATPEEWEVMSVTIKYDEGIVDLVLGDHEMNPITSMIRQTSGINRTVT
jgi:hypothetical protein